MRMQLSSPPESLGPDGDHRVRVSNTDFMPGGKYRGQYLYLLHTISAAADILTSRLQVVHVLHQQT
jgi:hypothetical protein